MSFSQLEIPTPEKLPGLFIVFEGGDGAGKTTQIEKLAEFLRSKSKEVLVTREPGGTVMGKSIRDWLLEQTEVEVDPKSEALLFAADRAHHMQTLIRPALAANKIVIGDRHIDSSVAYQGVARNLGIENIKNISLWAVDGILPNLIIVLDIDVEVGQSRLNRKDRLDRESKEFHEKVNKAYLELAAMNPEKYLVIDAQLPIDEIAGQIQNRVEKLI
ncbi:MAG: dTMP kinase [Candidatus Nanopelagicales bacterium]|jgi:dTMP kinase